MSDGRRATDHLASRNGGRPAISNLLAGPARHSSFRAVSPMEPGLYARLIDRLDRDSGIAADAELVLAACEGEEELETFLGGDRTTIRRTQSPEADRGRAEGAYLLGLTVEGFRGIGPEAWLDLSGTPGLTLVVERNGSGKSSFAECLEVLLTGDSYRWRDRVRAWRDGWRNLHHGSGAHIAAQVLIEGERGPTTI